MNFVVSACEQFKTMAAEEATGASDEQTLHT
jgi:hypothetical protein